MSRATKSNVCPVDGNRSRQHPSGSQGEGPKITSATIGRVLDYGETDTNNMGAAMAPAVADTILNHLRTTVVSRIIMI